MAETNWNTLALICIIALVGVVGIAALFMSQQGAVGQAGRPAVLQPSALDTCIANCASAGGLPNACGSYCSGGGTVALGDTCTNPVFQPCSGDSSKMCGVQECGDNCDPQKCEKTRYTLEQPAA